jgi:hypothetical protein
MSDCLVTKLKAEVNNNNLPKLGILPISCYLEESPSQQSKRLEIQVKETSAGSTLTAIGGKMATSYAGTYNLDTISTNAQHSAVAFLENKDYNIEVSNKYDVTVIYYGAGAGFKLSDLNFIANSIVTVSTAVEGNQHVTGDLSDLAICTHLELFRNNGSVVTGNIEDLVAGQIANGRTSGTLKLRLGGGTQYYKNKTQTLQPNTIYYLVFENGTCTFGS